TARLPEEISRPAYLAREASRFIRDHRDRPFCLFVNFLEPHMPFTGPRDDQYDPADVTLPDNFDDPPAPDQPLKTRLFHRHYREKGHGGFPLRTETDWRDQIRRYWGLCSLVDTHVGTLLRTLAECALDGNTIVVFTSDHGDMMGSHRLLAKCVMFEEAVRVPMMVRLPGRHAARRITGPVSQVDLVPTLLELMGQPVPRHLEGRSLAGLVAGESDKPCGDVFIEWNGTNSGISLDGSDPFRLPAHLRDLASDAEAFAALGDPVRSVLTPDGWKFNCSMRGDHELYNLNDDPFERRNLARDAEHRARREDLFARLRAWQQRTADNVTLPRPT
ncbi:MAG TPA: sulfatase-like hydrolase/transferase, partial [Planctomycetota bacterium]|nr:sulfatase-like hydrolase/transferase [Planctomycetota bacterium]